MLRNSRVSIYFRLNNDNDLKLQTEYNCQFHQHFMQAFFVWKQIAQFSLVMFQLCTFWRQNFVRKKREYNVDEIDARRFPKFLDFRKNKKVWEPLFVLSHRESEKDSDFSKALKLIWSVRKCNMSLKFDYKNPYFKTRHFFILLFTD